MNKEIKKYLNELGIDCFVRKGTGSMKNYINIFSKNSSFDFNSIDFLQKFESIGRFGNVSILLK